MTIFVNWHERVSLFQTPKIVKISNNGKFFIDMHKLLKCLVVMCLILSAGLQELHAQYDKDMFMMRGRHALAEGKYAQAIENFNVLSKLDTAD